MKCRAILFASVAVVGTLSFGSTTALAQAASAGASVENRNEIDDIVVTAQRREEKLQDVAIAATAISGDQLNAKAVQRIADLQFAAPSLSVTDQGLTQSVNIRGIGIASGSPSVANGVATYIDGVFQPPVLTASSFYDIGSIEVLRGPQGTLVGSNSTGGALFINTANPSTAAIGGYAEASYGSYNAVSLQGALNIPISSNFAVRVAGNGRWRDSYYTDIGPFKNTPDSLDEQAVRLSALWQTSDFRALAKVEFIDKNTGGYAYRPIVGTDFAGDRRANFRELTYNAPTLNHERGVLSSLELRHELSSGVVLRSISGYNNKRINNLYDMDGAINAPNPSISSTQTQDQFVRERQWSQEFNIISPTAGAFNWIVGGYLQKNKIDVDIQAASGSPTDPTDITISQDKTTWGVFVQTGYKLTQGLELQVGGRYSHFHVDGGGSVVIGAGGPIFGPAGMQVADLAGRHEDGRMTGKVALNWKMDDDNLLYVFAARGYKPGGSNSATSEFGPETVWDYEAGWKSSFLNNRIRTQLGVFYMDYRDFQFDSRDPTSGQTGVFNISNATIAGVELQVQAKAGGFSVDGGLAYVHSKMAPVTIVNPRTLPPLNQHGPQCPAGTPSNPPICYDYTPYLVVAGNGSNLFSPDWSYNVGAQYEVELGGDARLTPRVNYAFVGPRWTNLLYMPNLDRLAGRGLLSAQIVLNMRNWSLEVFGTNLANEKYVSGQSGNSEFYGAPREYGVRASVRF